MAARIATDRLGGDGKPQQKISKGTARRPQGRRRITGEVAAEIKASLRKPGSHLKKLQPIVLRACLDRVFVQDLGQV